MHSILPLLLLSAVAAPSQFDVQLLDGSKISGSLAAWTETQLAVETPAGRRELDVAKVASIAAHTPPAKPAASPAVWVDVADGSHLAGSEFTMQKGRANILLSGDSKELDVLAADVNAVRFQPESEATAIQWSQLRGKKLPGDLLVTGNQTGIDYHQGAIEDVADDKIRFTLEGKTLNVKRSKAYGLIFYHATASPSSDSSYSIVDAFGSRWAAASVKLVGDELEFRAAGGRTIRRDLAKIAQVDLSCGKIVFLGDLKPDVERLAADPFTLPAKELPSRLQFFRVRRDENLESKPLATHGQEFHKGMAMRSRSELAWTLPGNFSVCKRSPASTIGSDPWAASACRSPATASRSSIARSAAATKSRRRSASTWPACGGSLSSWSRRETSAPAIISFWAI